MRHAAYTQKELSSSLRHFWGKLWNLYTLFWVGGDLTVHSVQWRLFSPLPRLITPLPPPPCVSLCVCLYLCTFAVAGRGSGDPSLGFDWQIKRLSRMISDHRDALAAKALFLGDFLIPPKTNEPAPSVWGGAEPLGTAGPISMGQGGWVTHRWANLHHYYNASWQMSPRGESQSPGRVMQLGGTTAVNLAATGVR